jgi:hypothetical protein
MNNFYWNCNDSYAARLLFIRVFLKPFSKFLTILQIEWTIFIGIAMTHMQKDSCPCVSFPFSKFLTTLQIEWTIFIGIAMTRMQQDSCPSESFSFF